MKELAAKQAETTFAAASCSLSILRYLTDHIAHLPLGVTCRLLRTHDTPMLLASLTTLLPWKRSRRFKDRHVTERFSAGTWEVIPADERAKLSSYDA